MASTPPPLPSSSDDSEFDDDDFGCFKSSVAVKAPSSVIKQSEQNCKNSVHENYYDVTENESDGAKLCSNSNVVERSDAVCDDISKEQLTISNEESLPIDVSPSNHSFIAPSENHTSEEEVQNGISNVVDTSQSFLAPSEDTKVENNSSAGTEEQDIEEADQIVEEDNKVQLKCSITDEEKSINVEPAEEDSLPDVVNNCDNVSKDTDVGLFPNQQNDVEQTEISDIDKDSQEPADMPVNTCQAEDTEEDDFGDWGEVTESVEKDEHEEETINHDIINSSNDISETTDVSLQDDAPDIPSKIPDPEDIDDHQNSFPVGDDDDDFGDFADFSSHQEPKSDICSEENIPPMSFRTGSLDENCATDEDSNDVDVKNTDKPNIVLEKADGEDDDDWGFKSAKTDENVEGDDDFGNFGSADDNGDGDDWASFNEPSIPAVASEVVDDDFSDFSSNDLQPSSFSQSDSSSSKTLDSSSKVEKVVFLCFPSTLPQPPKVAITQNEENSDAPISNSDVETNEIDGLCAVVEMGIKITTKAKEETWTIVNEIRNKDPIVGTWGRLKDVNSSHALDYGWSNSYCCQEVFSTLHIDTKNVLFSQKKQAVPFYTTGLGILEPIRGGPNPGDKNQPSIQPTLLDTGGKPEETNKVLDIPPVDFDWGSSGLTNPLKVFKNESFNTGLSSLEPFSDVLQKNAEPSKELSAEAKSILSKIPNLNFMRSNVLMFPIKD